MGFLDAIFLGLVQGLTEFIPVSSSGHLILARQFFSIHQSDLAFDAVLQLATSFAIAVYFFRHLVEFLQDKKLVMAVVVGTLPAIVFGLILEDKIETVFRSSMLVAWMLIAGSALMYLADRHPEEKHEVDKDTGLIIGFFQTLAILPGISRSGATISGGILSGLGRDQAVRFSFLLSFPILFGSGIKKLLDLYQAGSIETLGWPLLLGSLVAFASGLGAIHFLITYLKGHKFTVFIWYRLALAAFIFVFAFI